MGATTAFASVASVSETFVNCPGQSARSWFGNVAFRLIVPVVMSTVLSMKESVPSEGVRPGPFGSALTFNAPAAARLLTSARTASGKANVT